MGVIISCSTNTNIPELNLAPKEVEKINRIWEEILSTAEASIRVGKIAFEGLFVRLPKSFELFYSFNKLSDWKNSKEFSHHCAVVSKIIGYIVKVINNPQLFDKNIDYMVSFLFGCS